MEKDGDIHQTKKDGDIHQRKETKDGDKDGGIDQLSRRKND